MDHPCVGVCLYDEATGFCEGCKLTSEEAQKWAGMTEEEQRLTLEEIEKRQEES